MLLPHRPPPAPSTSGAPSSHVLLGQRSTLALAKEKAVHLLHRGNSCASRVHGCSRYSFSSIFCRSTQRCPGLLRHVLVDLPAQNPSRTSGIQPLHLQLVPRDKTPCAPSLPISSCLTPIVNRQSPVPSLVLLAALPCLALRPMLGSCDLLRRAAPASFPSSAALAPSRPSPPAPAQIAAGAAAGQSGPAARARAAPS